VNQECSAALGVICSAVAMGAGPPNDSALTLRLTAGLTNTINRIPANGKDVFIFRAMKGQTLVLELNPCCPRCARIESDRSDRISVATADAAHPQPVSSRLPSDETSFWWVNVLPSSGDYRIIIDRPSGKRYSLHATLMDAHDPRLDPGISAEHVSISPEFLHGKNLALEPYEPGSFCEIDEN